ncbi:DUF4440 domain-containing protein [Streptomyces sp. AcH 505]|uniref:nuclear transport factor 2 family protein n=1 Tax=Streptomyces sp. AcH 505 TaxID=352211 RepID=UPI000AE4F444
MAISDPTPAVSAAVEGELRFLDPAVYASPARLGELLHDGFTSFGSSGTAYTRETYIDELRAWGASTPPGTVSGMTAAQLGPDLVHITFDLTVRGRDVHRSSLWKNTEEGWKLYFTQGTTFAS